MMDLKEIIKWFIPCLSILLYKKVKMCKFMYIFCLFLLFFARPSCSANVDSYSEATTKNIVSYNYLNNDNQSDNYEANNKMQQIEEIGLNMDTSVGRTFGRPMKKMIQALIPLAFQAGAATTFIGVGTLVTVMTLIVSLMTFKLILLAIAAKIGAFFAKSHGHDHGWQPHQKDIHLHVHGQPGPHDEHISSWNRDGATSTSNDNKGINLVINPYAAGPQTISTPYGNYVRLDSLSNNNLVLPNLNT